MDVVSLEPVDTDTGVIFSAHKTHLSEDVVRRHGLASLSSSVHAGVNPLSSIVIGKGLTSYIRCLVIFSTQEQQTQVYGCALKPCVQLPPNYNLLLN